MPAPSFVRHFVACNRRDLSHYADFTIGGILCGHIDHTLGAWLLKETDVFTQHSNGSLALHDRFTDFASRSTALAQAAKAVADLKNKKLRNEFYAVAEKFGDAPLAQIDRAGVAWFGTLGCGVHVNGFVRKADGIHLWIGERAADRPADPGKLDNMIGGGQPIGLTPEDNLCKEAHEEAGFPEAVARTAKHIGQIYYTLERPEGLRRDTLVLFDLELREDQIPQNTDGEVAAFHLMPAREVAKIIAETDRFKFNCNLVITDFLMRHGILDSTHPEYAEITQWLDRSRQPYSA